MACCYRDMRQKSLADWKAAKDQEELEAAEWHAEQQELQTQVILLLQISNVMLLLLMLQGPSSNGHKAVAKLP